MYIKYLVSSELGEQHGNICHCHSYHLASAEAWVPPPSPWAGQGFWPGPAGIASLIHTGPRGYLIHLPMNTEGETEAQRGHGLLKVTELGRSLG